MKTFIRILMVTIMLAGAATVTTVDAQDVDKLKYPKLNKLIMPDVVRETLDNGIRLYLVEDHALPTFNMSVRINVGSYLEPVDKVGLASVCGEVLRTGGTKKFTGDQIDELLEGVGASVETSIGLASGNARVNTLSENKDMAMDILAQVLRVPIFDEDKIDLAIVNARSAISRRNDDPQGLGFREFNRLIYGPNSVYARQSEYKSIANISRDDLIAFHETYFKPENIQIAVWGDFDTKSIVKSIKQRFGDWKRGSAPVPPLPKVEYSFKQQVHYISQGNVTQSGIFMGHIGGLVSDPDYADKIVMNNVMGGGLGNRMFNTVRSKEGLAYAAFGRYTSNIAYPGVFINYVGTKSETTGKAVKETIKVIQSMIDEPPTKEEMRKAKESYLNSFVFKFDTKSEVVNRMMNYDFHGIPDDFLFKLKDKIENVTSDDVVAAAKNNLRPDALLLLVVGKKEDFDIPLVDLGYGSISEIDITIPSGEEKRELAITAENLEKGKIILDKAVSAHGGLASFKNVHSVLAKGTYTLVMQGREIPLTFVETRVLPEKSSRLIEAFGQKIYDIHTETGGWKTDQATGQIVAKSEDDLLEDYKEMSRYNIRVFQSSENPSYRALYDGEGKVGDIAVTFVALIDSDDNLICRYGFDAASGEMVAKYYTDKTPVGEGTVEEIYSDFKSVEGITVPMSSVRNFAGNKIAAVTYKSFEINTTIDDSTFEKPE